MGNSASTHLQSSPASQPEGGDRQVRSEDERRQREDRILDAAVDLLVRWGFHKTTVDDVAREAGVGKGTIYLHWKDKNQMFQAALWRASRQAIDKMLERLADDPDGGQFHRLFAHGMVAVYDNPLLAAIMSGKTDIFRGLIKGFDSSTINQLIGTSSDQISRLQNAGLIRDDLPVRLVMFLIGALKTGIISASEYTPEKQIPSAEELTDALGDLMRRWLEPAERKGDGEEGRRIMGEWMDEVMKTGTANQSTKE